VPGPVLFRWSLAAAWAAVIFVLSAQPDLSSGLSWDYPLRKAAHVTEYAILGALVVNALRRPVPAFALGVAYAITDEVHQSFVTGRQGAPLDVVIDAAGVALGVLVCMRLLSRRGEAQAPSR
jgi:VanZ family protein